MQEVAPVRAKTGVRWHGLQPTSLWAHRYRPWEAGRIRVSALAQTGRHGGGLQLARSDARPVGGRFDSISLFPARVLIMPAYVFLGTLLTLLTAVPLAWKWGLGVLRTIVFVLAVALVVAGVLSLVDPSGEVQTIVGATLVWLMTMGTSAVVLAYFFYRDPERAAPDRDDVLVSPADGQVVYVHRSSGGLLPVARKRGRAYPLEELTRTPLRHQDAVVIGVSMSFLDVHVNRAPIGGQTTLQRHFPGTFGSLRDPEMVFRNERATTMIERDDLQVAVVQIASRLVRRIVAFISEGDEVVVGQRIGAIRFGSQVDVVMPDRDDVQVVVVVGDRVKAGSSILATFQPKPAAPLPQAEGERTREPLVPETPGDGEASNSGASKGA
jgi:phosphatidylserine decarboxylase